MLNICRRNFRWLALTLLSDVSFRAERTSANGGNEQENPDARRSRGLRSEALSRCAGLAGTIHGSPSWRGFGADNVSTQGRHGLANESAQRTTTSPDCCSPNRSSLRSPDPCRPPLPVAAHGAARLDCCFLGSRWISDTAGPKSTQRVRLVMEPPPRRY